MNFVAIDFETANRYRNSACAIGLARVEGSRVTQRVYRLIRPPFRWFEFSALHGIDWPLVQGAPTFAELWPSLAPLFCDVDFVAAHNAPFDAGVLRKTCEWYGLPMPDLPFRCTLKLARSWGLRPAKLSDVAAHLGIPLRHHHAGSDAAACAKIMLAA